MSDLQEIPKKPLRSGYTTGANATAATKAALLSLVLQKEIMETEITLPIGKTVLFKMIYCAYDSEKATATVIKDAGDDPDVTNKAKISATVSLNSNKEIVFLQGKGVGKVTLPGLQISVGEPAINPVPRKMMQTVCKKIIADHNLNQGVDITISVKNGEEMAKKTLNARLGILGGISILGTTGIVTPFSASSYIASIQRGIDVAIANNSSELLINSGGRSEKYLKNIYPNISEVSCIHYGNWIQETFEKVNISPKIKKVFMGIMLGKAAKLAQGRLNTHSGKTLWDKHFIYELAKEANYSESHAKQILDLNMAGRLTEIFPFEQTEPFYQKLLENCYFHCKKLAPNIQLTIHLIASDGKIINYQKT
ncbi:cobalt-precorrin-5B (C(1))-methyltransferase [Aureivirga sp. CE67]|uniref:cobalt-precorrin-5B (C(1))-methyltransferase n=1 Tax=Aureivirga sp. CE67 TaxID=1788983 RepID=UPI0018CA3329|nr:cobalt-precorrin-5B (C(1))-methyltransferase [Aureivirga sp. CE67]